MRKLPLLAMLAVLIVSNLAYARGYEVRKKGGDYLLEAEIDKNPPVVGDNNIKVEIKDASGKHVTDANVIVEYSMPAMPGMPAMNYKTDADLKGNEYIAKMNFSMKGSWNVIVKITKGSKTSSARFSVDVR